MRRRRTNKCPTNISITIHSSMKTFFLSHQKPSAHMENSTKCYKRVGKKNCIICLFYIYTLCYVCKWFFFLFLILWHKYSCEKEKTFRNIRKWEGAFPHAYKNIMESQKFCILSAHAKLPCGGVGVRVFFFLFLLVLIFGY